jgi:hypothetical protein
MPQYEAGRRVDPPVSVPRALDDQEYVDMSLRLTFGGSGRQSRRKRKRAKLTPKPSLPQQLQHFLPNSHHSSELLSLSSHLRQGPLLLSRFDLAMQGFSADESSEEG